MDIVVHQAVPFLQFWLNANIVKRKKGNYFIFCHLQRTPIRHNIRTFQCKSSRDPYRHGLHGTQGGILVYMLATDPLSPASCEGLDGSDLLVQHIPQLLHQLELQEIWRPSLHLKLTVVVLQDFPEEHCLQQLAFFPQHIRVSGIPQIQIKI